MNMSRVTPCLRTMTAGMGSSTPPSPWAQKQTGTENEWMDECCLVCWALNVWDKIPRQSWLWFWLEGYKDMVEVLIYSEQQGWCCWLAATLLCHYNLKTYINRSNSRAAVLETLRVDLESSVQGERSRGENLLETHWMPLVPQRDMTTIHTSKRTIKAFYFLCVCVSAVWL